MSACLHTFSSFFGKLVGMALDLQVAKELYHTSECGRSRMLALLLVLVVIPVLIAKGKNRRASIVYLFGLFSTRT